MRTSSSVVTILLAATLAIATASNQVVAADLDTLALQNYYNNNAGRQLNEFQERQRENCNYLCGNCGCRGYYCGDECICQCNRADESNVKCIQRMKSRSQQMAYPFEVLVQGPAGRRFIREAKDIDPETMAAYQQNERSGRSVYSIYKPAQVGKGELMAVADNPEVASAGPASATLSVLERAKLARSRLDSLRSVSGTDLRDRLHKAVGGSLLRSPHSEHVAAAEPTVGAAEPTVAAPAPAEAVVGAPAHAASADPIVAAPAPAAEVEHTVGAAAPEEHMVGKPLLLGGKALAGLIKGWPRLNVAPLNMDLFKHLGSPNVASPIVTQPAHTE